MYVLKVHTSGGELLSEAYPTLNAAKKAAERAAFRGWIWSHDGTTLILTQDAYKLSIIEQG
jgi:hypothetical protein